MSFVVGTGKEEIDPPQKMSVGIIIAAALAVVVCMVIATGMIVILIKRQVPRSQNKIKEFTANQGLAETNDQQITEEIYFIDILSI
jgi:hypothetical protein